MSDLIKRQKCHMLYFQCNFNAYRKPLTCLCVENVPYTVLPMLLRCIRCVLYIKQVPTGLCVCIMYVFMCMSAFSHCKIASFSLFSGLSPLHLAVLRGHRHLARMLLDAGADINAMVSPCAALTQR